MGNRDHVPPGARVGDVRVGCVALHLVDGERAGAGCGVVDVEAAARRVVGGEGHREQPLLASPRDPARCVQERRLLDGAVEDELDHTALLDDEQAILIAWGRGEEGRIVEGPDRVEEERLRRAGRRPAGAPERRDRREPQDESEESSPLPSHAARIRGFSRAQALRRSASSSPSSR